MAYNFNLAGGPFGITQGDTVELNLQAIDGDGNPVDITGAMFTTSIKGPNGVTDSFPNSQHTIVDAAAGKFMLSLSEIDTGSLGLGEHKEILTLIEIGSDEVFYRGPNLLAVYSSEPSQ